ncbi:DUF1036 domain-containing protein, partial [Pseudoxanthobacter sp.]|uniref:DUF1036 domain-containing protein n=1 Tax=Pseudoxanthobacter sp. TaxID=1925742 RepID=UPI002FE0B0AD
MNPSLPVREPRETMPSDSERSRPSRSRKDSAAKKSAPAAPRRAARVLGGALAAGLLLAPAVAHADLRLCNKTPGGIGVAIGYKTQKTWVTEGWWNVGAGTCSVIIEGPLNARFYYIYAVDNNNGGEWGGNAYLCTREKEFTIEGTEDCVRRGYERTGFFEIDTGEQRNWTVQLTDRPTAHK